MKILVFDNYDSFTYNLVFLIRELGFGSQMDVYRNDKIELKSVEKYDKILLSPGPGIPSEAGIMLDLIKTHGPTKDILGICLGHQGIAEAYGAKIFNMSSVLHGVANKVSIETKDDNLFLKIPSTFTISHYHSWSVVPETVNGSLMVTARDQDGLVMGIRHKEYNVRGLQFHTESVLTEYGGDIMKNWLHS